MFSSADQGPELRWREQLATSVARADKQAARQMIIGCGAAWQTVAWIAERNLIPSMLWEHPEKPARMEREIRAGAKLDDAHVVRLFQGEHEESIHGVD